MYAAYFNLYELPFDESSYPKFVWLGKRHLEALSAFKDALNNKKDFFLFTGDVGTGKTALVKRFLTEIDSNKIVASVSDPDLDKLNFFNYLSEAFEMGTIFETKKAFFVHFKKFLLDAYQNNTRVILIIDEAHKINQEILEEILLFTNLEKGDRKLINIIFSGWHEFSNQFPQKYRNVFDQKVAFTFHLEPLSENETVKLILHRLEVAGAKTKIFSPEALREVCRFSAGYPRLVVNICDLAMFTGYVRDKNLIDKDLVIECAQKLNITIEVEDDIEKIKYFFREKKDEGNRSGQTYEEAEKYLKIEKTPRLRKPLQQAVLVILLVSVGYLLSDVINFSFLSGKKLPWLQEPDSVLKEVPAKPFTEKRQDRFEENIPLQANEIKAPEVSSKKEAQAIDTGDRKEEFVADANKEIIVSQNQKKLLSEKKIDEPYVANNYTTFEVAESAMPAPLASKQLSLPTPEVKTSGQSPVKKVAETSRPSSGLTGDQNSLNLVPKETAAERHNLDSELVPIPKKSDKSQIDIASRKSETAVGENAKPIGKAKSPSEIADPELKILDRNTGSFAASREPEISEVKSEGADRKPTPTGRAQDQQTAPEKSVPQDLVSESKLEPASKASKIEEKPPSQIASLEPKTLDSNTDRRLALESRLQSFLQNYCRTYAAKDLDQFTTFFTSEAKENGKPVSDLWSKYRRNFDSIEQINYRIELQEYSYDGMLETVKIEGRFFLRWLPRGASWRENSGKIHMVLKGHGPSYQVDRLDYSGDRRIRTQ